MNPAMECGYCGGTAIESNGSHVHATDGERIRNISPGDYVSARHNMAGTAILAVDVVPASCAWFAMCPNEATGTVSHPVLGDVPTCDRCREKATGKRDYLD